MTIIPPSLPPVPAQQTPIRRSAEALETSFLAEMLKSAGVYKRPNPLAAARAKSSSPHSWPMHRRVRWSRVAALAWRTRSNGR